MKEGRKEVGRKEGRMEKTKIGGGVQVSKERNNIGEKQSKIYKGRCAG